MAAVAAATLALVASSSLQSSPDFVASLDQGLRLLELLHVDQISDVTRQFAEEKDCLDFFHCRWLQGGEVVPHDGGPVVAATQVIQPFACPLKGAEAVGAKQDVLQLLVQVPVGGGTFAQRAEAVNQREREL